MDLEQQLRQSLNGTYRIERELGGGGMSRVFAAEELALGRTVALKVLVEHAAGVSGDRFQREIVTVAKLHHPHIVPLLSAGVADSAVFYTMPLVQGESLRARLHRVGQLPISDAVAFARDVADALAYAHRQGVIHRDIKPDNILLAGQHAVVTDFGVAKALSASATTGTLTATGMAIGTPLYMAPEQALADPGADHRVDLYALGCVLYEMLAGRPPFEGSTLQQVMSGHLTQTPEPLPALRKDVPADVTTWVQRAMSKNPDERWRSADDALAELQDCVANLSGSRVAAAKPANARDRRRWLLAAIPAVVALVVAGVLWRQREVGAEDADRIAVMPFVPASLSDTSLARLGRDLVVTLTANLDGVGDLRMIDPLAVLAQTSANTPADPRRAAELASGMGARRALIGTLLRVGDRARLDYRLISTAGSDAPLVFPSVTGPLGEEGIVTLTDSATWGMLATLLPERGGPLPSFELIHTRSVPALRAFIDGENHLLANRWTEAERSYARAIEADSTFWFAYRRVFQAADWNFGASRRTREDSIAWAHREGFPARERLLMEATRHERFGDELRALAEITRQFPDYWYGWFQYGDHVLHNGTRLLLATRDAAPAMGRAYALNPRLIPVLHHRFFFSFDTTNVEPAYAAVRQYYGAAWDTTRLDEGLLPRSLYDPILSRWQRGSIEPAVLVSLAADLAAANAPPAFLDFITPIPVFVGDPRSQLELGRQVRATGAAPATLPSLDRWSGVAWAMRGAWDSSLVALDRAWAAQPSAGLARVRAATGVMAAFVGVADERMAAGPLRDLHAYRGTPAAMSTTTRLGAFLDGMLAYSEGRTAGIDSARATLEGRTRDPSAGFLARALGAFGAALAGDSSAAADSLLLIEHERGVDVSYDYDVVPFIRLAAGRWQAAAGRAAVADSLLTYTETGATSIPAQMIMRETVALALLERARSWQRAGDAARAAPLYKEFLRLYDLAPAAHRQWVEEANAAVAGSRGR